MANQKFFMSLFVPATATPREWEAVNVFDNRIHAEQWPEDPPLTVEDTIHDWSDSPAFREVHAWTVWSADAVQIVAMAFAVIWRTSHNRHLAEFHISVLPECRQRGCGRQLLAAVADVAYREQRRLLLTTTDASTPAGAIFLKRLGGQVGIATHTNQLILSELNRDLIRRWQDEPRRLGNAYEIGFWDEAYPQGVLAAMASLRAVMNTAPRDALELEDIIWTDTQLRQIESTLAHHQTERWTMYGRHPHTGAVVGYTEVFWNARDPATLNQGDTGVVPTHRHHGLGRWLKAAMLEKVLHERPQGICQVSRQKDSS
jgi:mycothiol synthase